MSQVHKIHNDNDEYKEFINPATGKVTGQYKIQSQEEAEKIIDDAHEAFLEWREVSLQDRAKVINKIGTLLSENKDELVSMMTQQMGKTVAEGKSEVDLCAAICKYTAEQGPEFLADEERNLDLGRGLVTYEPLGVILGMQPWNFPLYQAVRYSVAVLLGGNATVFKHSDKCWETAQRLQEIYEEAGLPENTFRALFVDNETVDELIEHDKVRGVTLTGSAVAGKIVAKKAGENLKKTVLELGGSDPYIVLDDVNMDDVISACVQGRTNNTGQTCIAAKRFIVLESVYDEFKEKFVQAMSDLQYGDPSDPDTVMGPMAGKELREDLHEQVQECIEKGATCLTGGEMPEGEGYFYPATVLENIKPGMPAYDDELFGPVAALFKVKDEEEAIELANDHRYGLGGGVFSSDEDRAIRLARRIDTGMVNVNGYAIAQPNMPFGGVKESGYGREHGGFGVREFMNAKSLFISE